MWEAWLLVARAPAFPVLLLRCLPLPVLQPSHHVPSFGLKPSGGGAKRNEGWCLGGALCCGGGMVMKQRVRRMCAWLLFWYGSR